MTAFRQFYRLLFVLFCCGVLLLAPVAAEEPAGEQNARLQTLQDENRTLQRQVRRLEHQVAALRDELNTPGASQVIGGIGYIVGLFGVAIWVAARKKTAQEK